MCGLLLQCNIVGKAQEVCAVLPIEQSLDYDVVKTAVVRTNELVPEAYRQRFQGTSKTAKQTFELAREKRTLFKWCLASKVISLDQLQELILLEEFKNCIPENIVVHLNEFADEFALTHRLVFSSICQFKC